MMVQKALNEVNDAIHSANLKVNNFMDGEIDFDDSFYPSTPVRFMCYISNKSS